MRNAPGNLIVNGDVGFGEVLEQVCGHGTFGYIISMDSQSLLGQWGHWGRGNAGRDGAIRDGCEVTEAGQCQWGRTT